MEETLVQPDHKDKSIYEAIGISHHDTHHTRDDIGYMVACVKTDIRDRVFDARVIDRLFVAVCVSDVQCRDMIEDLVRWAPLPSDSKQLYYIENQQKIDLLERDWSRHNSRSDFKEERQTMVFIKREHPYENVAVHLARFRLLLAFRVGSGIDWDAIQHLYRFAAISNLSKSNGYSHHVLDALLRYKEISLKSAMCAIMTGMFHDLSSFSFDFLSNSGLDPHKDKLIKIGLLSSLLENFETINLHYSQQSTQDQISKYRYHPLVNHILEYLNYCSYEEAAKVLEIMLNDKICNLDSNATIRILGKETTLDGQLLLESCSCNHGS